MHATYPTETRPEPADRHMPATVPTADVRPRLVEVVASDCVLDEFRAQTTRCDHEPRAGLDTSGDPTGAALAWPFVILLVYVGLALGFVVAR
jgi:hypothetical protein